MNVKAKALVIGGIGPPAIHRVAGTRRLLGPFATSSPTWKDLRAERGVRGGPLAPGEPIQRGRRQ